MTARSSRRFGRTFWPAAPLLLCLVAGCGPDQGKLTGRVLVDGKPLTGGWVTFVPARGNSVTARIDENGNYTADVPPGPTAVCVDNRVLKPQPPRTGERPPLPSGLSAEARARIASNAPPKSAPPPPPPIPGKYMPIPERYHTVDPASDLTFTVQKGDQTHDIELKSN